MFSRQRRLDKKLFKAATVGDLKRVCALLTQGAKPDGYISRGGFSALLNAAMEGHYEVAEVLIKAGAEIDRKTRYGWTPYLAAARYEQEKTLDLLLGKGANKNGVNSGRFSALHLAIFAKNLACVNRLLREDIDTTLRDEKDRTAIVLARELKQDSICRAIEAHERCKRGKWSLSGPQEISGVEIIAGGTIEMTEVFNFATQERTTILRHNDGQMSHSRESFRAVSKPALAIAREKYAELGGADALETDKPRLRLAAPKS